MENTAILWTTEHLNSPTWGTDLVLRKKDTIDETRIHLTDICKHALVTEADNMLCWEYDGILWIEDKYNTTLFHIEAQKQALDNNVSAIPVIRTMQESKLKELYERKAFLEKLIKSGISLDWISWVKLDALRHI